MENYTPDYFDPPEIPKPQVQQQENRSSLKFKVLGIMALVLGLSYGIYICICAHRLSHPSEPAQLKDEQALELSAKLDSIFSERTKIVKELPYKTIPANLDVYAESAIIIDAASGNILYEKNADRKIPPASMTKLVEMYVVYEAIKNGEVAFDDIVPLPPKCWAVNLPRDASIMFLAQGQTVTLRELLLGLAIASGNDASIAVAEYVCGSMDDFVKRMNDTVASFGLKNTRFVESSGYSEYNYTTAREFAAFCRRYVNDYPESLAMFHSQKVLAYPQQHNLPREQQNKESNQPVIQYNTNKLLGLLPGCDGLKTGFIYESGYNLALTACRNGTRFISITMKGPGIGSVQGNRYRIHDHTIMEEFAFEKFDTYRPSQEGKKFLIPVAGGKQKAVNLVPALDEAFSVPFISGETPRDAAEKITVQVKIPACIFGQVELGNDYGSIHYLLDGKILRTIPLVADRNIEKANIFAQASENLAAKICGLKH